MFTQLRQDSSKYRLFCVDAFSPAPAGNQGPPAMMGMNMNNRGTIPGPPMGPGPAMGPEGAANMGTPMMPDNGAVVMYHAHYCDYISSIYFCPKGNFTLNIIWHHLFCQ